MTRQTSEIYVPLFILQIPQKTLGRFGLCQKDWVELLGLLMDIELTESSLYTTFVALEDYRKVILLAKNLFGAEKFLRFYVEDTMPPHLGPIGLAMSTAPTVGDAMQIWLDNVPILAPMLAVDGQRMGDRLRFNLCVTADLGEIRDIYVELALLLTAKLGSVVSGARTPAEIHFTHARQLPGQFYRDCFGVDPVFEASENCIILAEADLALLNGSHAPLVYQQAQHDIRLLAQNAAGQSQLKHRVRQLLVDGSSRLEFYSLEEVAKHFHCSARTLARRLNDEGATFRDLQCEARIEIAKQLLREPAIPLKVVFARVGFSDGSTFSRAFRRYTALTPKEYREKHLVPGEGTLRA